jgi:hypothetical protein
MRGEVDFAGRQPSRAHAHALRRPPLAQANYDPPGPTGHDSESLLSQRIPARSGVGLAGARGWGRY